MRATQHSGRMGSGEHNGRDFELNKAKHIDRSLTPQNTYWCVYTDMNFAAAERRFYAESFTDMIADTNRRAELSRHPERMTDPDKLLASKKTMPEEVIFQIGDKDSRDKVPVETLLTIFNDFHEWHDKKFGAYVKTLDIALHVDEQTPHIHVRRVWTHQHQDGFTAIGQHKALEQLGYQLPDKTEPRGRNNNLKMPYTAECREKWLDLCQARGLEIERVPEHRAPNEQNLKKGDYIIRRQNNKITENREIMRGLNEDIAAVDEAHVRVAKKLQKTRDELSEAKTELRQVRGEILTAEQAQTYKLKKSAFSKKYHIEGTPEELADLIATAQQVNMDSKIVTEATAVLSERDSIITKAKERADKLVADAKKESTSFNTIAKMSELQSKLSKYERLEEMHPETFARMRKTLQRTQTKEWTPSK